jgi:hypothetical protein
MDTAVCVTEETDIHVGFVNRKEPMNHVLGARDTRVSDANYWVCEHALLECGVRIRSQIQVHDPSRVVGLDQVKVLKESVVVDGFGLAV